MIEVDLLGPGVCVSTSFQKFPCLVGRLGSGVRISANFQIFALKVTPFIDTEYLTNGYR